METKWNNLTRNKHVVGGDTTTTNRYRKRQLNVRTALVLEKIVASLPIRRFNPSRSIIAIAFCAR